MNPDAIVTGLFVVVLGAYLLWDASKLKPGTCLSCAKEVWVREYYNDEGLKVEVCDELACQHERWVGGFIY